MATDGTPARKSRRIVNDDEDDDELPDVMDPGFLKYGNPSTPQPAEEKADQESDAEGLFSNDDDDDEGSEKEEKSSPSKKRYQYIL